MKEFENYKVLAIENARGGTLGDLMKKRQSDGKPLNDEECSKVIKGIFEGLRHIHKFDFVHRDLKPSNIVIGDLKNLESMKLVDFGLAIKF
jgi:serine/threonine protein kinase